MRTQNDENHAPGPDAQGARTPGTEPALDQRDLELHETMTSLARLESLYAALMKASAATVRIKELDKLYERVCQVLVEEGLASMAWVGTVAPGTQVVEAAAWWGNDDGFLQVTRHSALEIPAGLGPPGIAARMGRTDICGDLRSEPRMLPWRTEATKRGYVSCASFPIRLGDQVTGTLTLYAPEPDAFDNRLVKMLESLAADISFSIDSIEQENRRRRAEVSLRRSEEYYRTLIENAQDITAVIDSKGSITYVSPSVERVLGYRRAELREKYVFQFLHPEDVERLVTAHAEVISSPGLRRQEEARFRHKNGFYLVLDLVGRSFRDEAGEFSIVVNARDITERQAIAEAQRKDRDFISAVLDTASALVVVYDSDGRMLLFNSACEQLTGFSFDEVRGRTPAEFLIPSEEFTEMYRSFQLFLAGDVSERTVEGHWVTRHGARRLISWSNTLLPGGDGSASLVISTGIDVTEHRQAESDLKKSEEQYRTIFESTGTAMCIIDQDCKIEFLNVEFERMTGWGAEEIEGTRQFTDFIVEEDVTGFMSYHRETRRGVRRLPIHFECKIVDKAGNELNVLANMGLLPGQAVSVLSLIDVTRERTYEHDLAETAERLRHFLTVASHELRHPITIVKGYANTLSGYIDELPREHVLEILEDIDASTDRLTHYVEELMDVSRVEEGRFPVCTQLTDSEKLIQTAFDDMQVMGIANPFSSTVGPGASHIEVDPEKFVQLLVILVENAVKFSPEKSPVEVIVQRSGQWIEGMVLDRGMGISEEDRPKVFDRFYQVEDTMHHSTPGMGLGLYIAHEIVGAHGGTITCEPREGGGSIFRFKLPAAKQNA